ncbi:Alanine--tRNA ligase [Phycisphaerae bacterium RAS2]|nr:Alanine--tRNA ligase [Phycisphaerae bacterium RAS2]
MNTPRSAAQIRREFIEYFVRRCGHTFVPSSPVVPHDDPTLMFTNAGMNQFKPIFLGQRAPDVDKWPGATPGMASRAANTQKCIRAGGKHNDLDDVGHDTYHHTFFEMLGNWSFGDYFKKEAIEWAWDLLTNVWGIDPGRLHATYFEGDASEGLEPDNEARDLWLKILPPERVHPGNKKDNFWEMGDTGPCGPCSEVHIDLTPDKSGGKLVNAGDARVMEIWNLVFIQFNRGPDGKLSPLPAKHVDTGMGFERICSVIRGTETGRLGQVSNYDTDVFTPIFAAIQRVTGAAAYTGLLESGTQDSNLKPQVFKDVAYRVVADHLRTLTFAITDGASPSNEGRGYVLRRILRRAVRYGRQYLGTSKPFLCELIPAVADAMGEAFPELRSAHGGKNVDHVAAIIRDEEASFIKTLDRGIALFDEAAKYAAQHHHGRISGEDAFKLHDTYGFPIDLTELMAEERGMTVNIGEYERLMEEAREKARGAGKSEAAMPLGIEGAPRATDDTPKFTSRSVRSKVIAYSHEARWHGSGPAPTGCAVGIVVASTCAYGEQGGQVGDSGMIRTANGEFRFEETKRLNDIVIHIGKVLRGNVSIGDEASIEVDSFRETITRNHTATHLMNWALREVLGEHVQQKGSLVDPDKTRFDLSHHAAITEDELARIEQLTNEQIARDLPVFTNDNVPVDQKSAMKINGLRAVFGEKYPDQVRVVSIGVPVTDEDAKRARDKSEWSGAGSLLGSPGNPEWRKYSVEFCGGTHVKRTGEIAQLPNGSRADRAFVLVEESAVAKGIRRVVGVTGEKAVAAQQAADQLSRELDAALTAARNESPNEPSNEPRASARAAAQTQVPPPTSEQLVADLNARLATTELPVLARHHLRAKLAELQELAKKQKKEQSKAGAADVIARADELLAAAERVNGVALICGELGSAGVEQLRGACDSLRSRAGSAAILLAAENDGKAVLLAAMTADVVARGIKAGDLIKEIAPLVGGKGGGKPDLAQGGGPDAGKIGDAIAATAAWLKTKLG